MARKSISFVHNFRPLIFNAKLYNWYFKHTKLYLRYFMFLFPETLYFLLLWSLPYYFFHFPISKINRLCYFLPRISCWKNHSETVWILNALSSKTYFRPSRAFILKLFEYFLISTSPFSTFLQKHMTSLTLSLTNVT